jgi:hypothetical protein
MKKILFIHLLMLLTAFLYANDIQLANTGLTNQNTTTHRVEVKFDVNWKNSWRTSTNEANYDGAWLFVKFRKVNTSLWQHCSLNTAGFTAPSGSSIKVSADQKGCWIYSSANQIGDVNYTGGKLVWNYGGDGVLDADSVEIRVFAVEMVYVLITSAAMEMKIIISRIVLPTALTWLLPKGHLILVIQAENYLRQVIHR